jgi:hypothetical protein
MHTAINLDCKMLFMAVEVNYESADRVLAAKFFAPQLSIPQS